MQACEKTNPQQKVALPKDTGPHLFSNIEWWYCYAFLDGNNGGKYGVIVSFFSTGLIPFLKGHYLIFSLIDMNGHSYQSFSLLDKNLILNMNMMLFPYYLCYCPRDKKVWKTYNNYLKYNICPPHRLIGHSFIKKNPVRLVYENNTLHFIQEKNGYIDIHLQEDTVEISLKFITAKPASMIGSDGKPNQLYYYSFTNNMVSGYVKKGSSMENVTGKGWFDHQWGFAQGLLSKIGWSWFGLQLDDGRELLISELGSFQTGQTFSPMANLILQDGSIKFTSVINLEPFNFWESPITGGIYPQNWYITIPELMMNLEVSTDFCEQEMPIIFPLEAIWEGICSVSGYEMLKGETFKHISGRGFMELMGYASYESK